MGTIKICLHRWLCSFSFPIGFDGNTIFHVEKKIECHSRLTHFVINLIVHDITWHFVFIVFIVFGQSICCSCCCCRRRYMQQRIHKPPYNCKNIYVHASQAQEMKRCLRLCDHILQHLRHKWVDRIELRGN